MLIALCNNLYGTTYSFIYKEKPYFSPHLIDGKVVNDGSFTNLVDFDDVLLYSVNIFCSNQVIE
jgi:hypothetical protein